LVVLRLLHQELTMIHRCMNQCYCRITYGNTQGNLIVFIGLVAKDAILLRNVGLRFNDDSNVVNQAQFSADYVVGRNVYFLLFLSNDSSIYTVIYKRHSRKFLIVDGLS